MRKERIPFIINIILFNIALLLNLITHYDQAFWGFLDSKDYLKQSEIPLLTRSFFFTQPEPGFYPRPFTVPLFYKICGGYPVSIIQMQRYIHTLATFLLALGLMLMVKNWILKCLLAFSIYFLMSWWNILGWTTQLLSESLSMSFLFLWIGSILILLHKPKWYWLVLHILITVLFSFTRDSWLYVIVLCYMVLLIISLLFRSPLCKYALVLVLFSALLYFFQTESSMTAQRTKLPLVNSIVIRITPDSSKLLWFWSHGMPMGLNLRFAFGRFNMDNPKDVGNLYSIYDNPSWKNFTSWCAGKGKGVYIKFLLTHPGYTLLLDELKEKLKPVLAMNLKYIMKENGYSVAAGKVFPLFDPFSLMIFQLMLLVFFLRRKKMFMLLPVVFSLLTLFNVLLLYNADAMEVPRHLFITMILIQVIGIWTLALLFDEIIQLFNSLSQSGSSGGARELSEA